MNGQDTNSLHATETAQELWFGSFHGVLSSQSQAMPGFPFGSLIPFCRDSSGIPILLLAHLAQHTKNLSTTPTCSLLVQEWGKTDVQQLARLTCLAEAEWLHSPSLAVKERYFRFYPESRVYFEELNFQFYQLKPVRFYFIGGFGVTRWVDPSQIIFKQNWVEDEEKFLATIRAQLQANEAIPASDSIVGMDPKGLDLRNSTKLTRLMLKRPAKSANEFLSLLPSSTPI